MTITQKDKIEIAGLEPAELDKLMRSMPETWSDSDKLEAAVEFGWIRFLEDLADRDEALTHDEADGEDPFTDGKIKKQ